MGDAMDMVMDDSARQAPVNRFEAILQKKKSSRAAAEAVEESEMLRSAKPTGMARELMDLIGGRPPVVASSAPLLKKADLSKTMRVRAWRWVGFRNPGRGDDALVLSHWEQFPVNSAPALSHRAHQREQSQDQEVAAESEPKGMDVDADAQPAAQGTEGSAAVASGETPVKHEYPFAKFNKKITVPRYTQDEYLQCLLDPTFSEEETMYLLELCERFDLRFIVVHDRFVSEGRLRTPPWPKRSVEDLKARYYNVVRRLGEVRGLPEDSVERSYVFDKKHEEQRKLQLRKLNARTYAQMAEEASLRAEWKKIRQRQREQGISTGDGGDGYSSDGSVSRKGHKRKSARGRGESGGGAAAGDEGDGADRTASGGSLAPGVYLRSQLMQKQMAQVKPKIAQYVTKTCEELKIGNPLPTARIAAVYTEVRDNLIELANVQQQIQARQYELIALREKHAELLKTHGISDTAAAGPSSSVKRTISASLLPTSLEGIADPKKPTPEEEGPTS